MRVYTKEFEVRWADMDPNKHMRHSAYDDYANHTRLALFTEIGLSYEKLSSLNIGPILFSENVLFKREIDLCEKIMVKCHLSDLSDDGKYWSFVHYMYKENGILAAEITVKGAWIDLHQRKLAVPPEEVLELLQTLL